VQSLRQTGFMAFGALAPEFVATFAYTQRRNAQKLLRDYQNIRRAAEFPMPQVDFLDVE
jgi:hypothetical protein